MKAKLIFFGLFLLISLKCFSQNISIKDYIAYVDGKEYIKIIKENKRSYMIKNLTSNEDILKINVKKAYNFIQKKHWRQPKVIFISLNKSMGFENVDIKNKHDVVKFIYEYKLVFLDGTINKKMVLDFYTKLKKTTYNNI